MKNKDDILRNLHGRTTIVSAPGVLDIQGGVVSFSAPLPKPKPKPEKDKGK